MKKVAEEKQGVVARAKADCEELLVEIVQDKRVADEQEKQVGGRGGEQGAGCPIAGGSYVAWAAIIAGGVRGMGCDHKKSASRDRGVCPCGAALCCAQEPPLLQQQHRQQRQRRVQAEGLYAQCSWHRAVTVVTGGTGGRRAAGAGGAGQPVSVLCVCNVRLPQEIR